MSKDTSSGKCSFKDKSFANIREGNMYNGDGGPTLSKKKNYHIKGQVPCVNFM